jgi:hypothetical protein
MIRRRTFLAAGLSFPYILPSLAQSILYSEKELHADVVILGGGTGGCAAALAALRNGMRVIMTEETDWIGGQMTSQGVPPDEHRWIEQTGCTASYRAYRDGVREYYRQYYPLSEQARSERYLNPGSGSVSRLCHEPYVGVAVLRNMLAPYISGGKLRLMLDTIPTSAEVDGDWVKSVTVKNTQSGHEVVLQGTYFLDATELGDLLPMTKIEYVTGFESKNETGEMHAPDEAQPDNMQAVTWCFAVDYLAGEDHTIDKPEMYNFFREYEPKLNPSWPGKLLSFTYSQPNTLKPFAWNFDPVNESENKESGFWTYRRIAHITVVNWPMNDYWLGNLCEVSEEERQKHLHQAMQLSYSWLYWLQTECERADGKAGYPGLRLRGDIMGTEHGLAKTPYIRESRRIQAEFTVKEEHVGTEMRMAITGKTRDEVKAAEFADRVGIGAYRIDLHPSTGGDNYIDFSSLPFQIPLGALIPKRMENLLPACKNLGVTHITNGCYRLHPVEWNIGEAAGALAAHCVQTKESPRSIYSNETKRTQFQRVLEGQGVELSWMSTRPL